MFGRKKTPKEFDPAILLERTTQLDKKARSVVANATVGGALIGLVVVGIVDAIPTFNPGPLLYYGVPGILGLVGMSVGQGRAFMMRVQAEELRGLLSLHERLGKLEPVAASAEE